MARRTEKWLRVISSTFETWGLLCVVFATAIEGYCDSRFDKEETDGPN